VHPGLVDTVERQCGIVTRAQVVAVGLTDDWLAHQVRSRRWRPTGRGVYATTTGELTTDQRHWAAVLRCGPGAALAGDTAVGLWVPERPAVEPLTVAVDERRRVEVGDIDVWLVQNLTDVVHPAREPPRLKLEEAVLMTAARRPTLDDAVGLVADVCSSRRTTASRLRAALLRLPTNLRFRRQLRELLDDVAAGAYSYLEVHYLRRVERPHGLPVGSRQRRVVPGGRPWYRDVEYVGYAVVAELDGRLGHETYVDRGHDMDRDNVTVVGGSVAARFGYPHVLRRSCESAAVLARLLRDGGWKGELRRCGPRCRVAERT
jgi:hypothetical protein